MSNDYTAIRNDLQHLVDILENKGILYAADIERVVESLNGIQDWNAALEKRNTQSDTMSVVIDSRMYKTSAFNCSRTFSEVKKIKEGLDILFMLYKQKTVKIGIISRPYASSIYKLLQKELVSTITVNTSSKMKSYYTLSGKGLLLLNDLETQKKICSINRRYTIPRWGKYAIENISGVYFLQTSMINDYMIQTECLDYFTFTMPDHENLVFACRIDAEKGTHYVCAKYIDNDEAFMDLIKPVLDDNIIDSITVIHRANVSTGRNLFKNDALLDKIHFFRLEDDDE